MKSKTLRVGIGQVKLTDSDWQSNVDVVSSSYEKLCKQDCEFSIFSELWPSAMDLSKAKKYSTLNQEKLIPLLKELTQEKKVYSHWGSMLYSSAGKFYNRALILNSSGEEIITYEKNHLFGLMGEDNYLSAGKEQPIAETPWGKIATAICYDLRFPELFRFYALSGVKIVFLPAQWPHPRLNHWRQLIQARAIENQIFMVACNRVGKGNKYDFFGHSMVVDPWGKILYEGPEEADLASVELDLTVYDEARQKLNSPGDVNYPLFFKNFQIGNK